MRHIFRAALLVVFAALVMGTLRVTPASAETITENTVNEALAAVGQPALSEVDTDGVVNAGQVSVSGEGESVAQTTDDGAQVLTVLRKGNRATFKLDLPRGAEIVAAPDGRLGIYQTDALSSRLIAVVDAPWAVDANGKKLPTSYTVRGKNKLVQDVDTTGAVYPVVADPSVGLDWGWGGPEWKIYFSKHDVQEIVAGHGGWYMATIAALACSKLGNPAGAAACAVVASYYGYTMGSMFLAAFRAVPNNCIFIKTTYNGILLEWYRYNC